jgi:ABC-type transporter Mla subunit MlaD
MSVITRLGGDKLGPETSGPEQYAPPEWRAREKLPDVDPAAANGFEGEIREFLRRDVSLLHQQQSDADPAKDPAAENLNELIRRIASASMEEIDGVILELQGVRDMLRNEGERLSHEVARYATLNQMSMTAIKAVGDSLKQSKGAPKQGVGGYVTPDAS